MGSEENCPPTPTLTLTQTLNITKGQYFPGGIAWFSPNSKTNPNLDRNTNPNRGAIFLGEQLSGYRVLAFKQRLVPVGFTSIKIRPGKMLIKVRKFQFHEKRMTILKRLIQIVVLQKPWSLENWRQTVINQGAEPAVQRCS